MKRYTYFFSVLMVVLAVSERISSQTISFKTAVNASDWNMMFELQSSKNSQQIKIIWGDVEKTYTIDKEATLVDSEIDVKPSTTVVIEGDVVGLSLSNINLEYLDVSKNKGLINLEIANLGLKSVDLSKNINLEYLDLNSNELSVLDLTNNKKLKTLNLAACMTEQLFIDHCSDLEVLNIAYNSLETLLLHPNVRLKYFRATQNKISKLDFFNQTELETFVYDSGTLQELDLSSSSKLVTVNIEFSKTLQKIVLPERADRLNYINVSECALAELNIANYPNLQVLNCSNNKLTELDLTKSLALKELYCSMNHLKTLDISGNQNLKELFCANNNFSSEALNKVYKELPPLSVRPQNPNLYVGGNNQYVGAKSYLAELKNWYPTDRGNGGGGRPTAFFSNIGGNFVQSNYEVCLEVEALTSKASLFYDSGTGEDKAIELKDGKAQLFIQSNGNLVVMGNVKALKVEGLEMYRADFSTMPTLQSIDISKSNVKDLTLADNSALKKLFVSDCPEMTYLYLKSQPQLHYLDVRNCSLTATTMNDLFELLPKLAERPDIANLLIAGNLDENAADYDVAYAKNWNFDIPVSTGKTTGTDSKSLKCVMVDGAIIVNSVERAHLVVAALDGNVFFDSRIEAMSDICVPVVSKGTYVLKLFTDSGKMLCEKILYKP